MKTNITTTPAAFAPVSITITFETQRELDAFGTAMNCYPITMSIEYLGEMPEDTILDNIIAPLQRLGSDTTQTDRLLKMIKAKS